MIKNQYEYTQDLVREIIGKWWGVKFGKGYIIMGLLAIICLFSPYKYMVVFPLFVILMIVLKTSRAIQLETKRMQVIYGEKSPVVTVNMGNEIEVSTDQKTTNISYSNIQKVVLTKRCIVLFIEGSMTVALKKDGFVQGTLEECLDLLKKNR